MEKEVIEIGFEPALNKLVFLSAFLIALSAVGMTQLVQSQGEWNAGTFNETSADRDSNSGDLGLGYLNGTNSDNIESFYRFDADSAKDYGGENRDGTIDGGVSVTNGVFSTESYSFDGSSGYVDVPQQAVPQWWNGEDVTVSAWFKTTGSGLILGNEGGDTEPGNGNGWVPSLYVDTDGSVRTSLFWHGDTRTTKSPGTYNDGNWHHVAVTYKDGTETLYVDGVEVAQDTGLNQNDYNSGTYSYFIGSGKWNNWPSTSGTVGWFNGDIDEVKIYDRELGAGEVKKLYFNGASGDFNGSYTSQKLENTKDQGWESITVNATIPASTSANVTFRALSNSGTVQYTDKLSIQDGEKTYNLNVQSTPDAEFIIRGNSSDPAKTWSIEFLDIETLGPPQIDILSPPNETIETTQPYLNATSNQQISSWKYNVDGGPNQSSINKTISVSDGSHSVKVWAKNKLGIWNSTTRYFTVNSSAPFWRNLNQQKDTVPATGTNTLEAEGLDAVNLTEAILSTNETGSFENKTGKYNSPINPYTSSVFSLTEFNWQNNSIRAQTVGWRIWYGDKSGKYNSTDTETFFVENDDTVPPNVSVRSPETGFINTDTVLLNYSADEPVAEYNYRLDSGLERVPGYLLFFTNSSNHLNMVMENGTLKGFSQKAAILADQAALDSDRYLETPFIDPNGELKTIDRTGEVSQIDTGLSTSKTTMAVGRLQSKEPYVYYQDASNNGYITRARESEAPSVVGSGTGTNGVLGVADFNVDGDKDLVFLGSSDTIKFLDGGTVSSTGFSSFGANNNKGVGSVDDVDRDGKPRVPYVTGSNNLALIDFQSSEQVLNSNYGQASKTTISTADWLAGTKKEIIFPESSTGELKLSYLNGTVTSIKDESGNAIESNTASGISTGRNRFRSKLTDLAEGSHTVNVSAIDFANNLGSELRSFKVDTVSPQTRNLVDDSGGVTQNFNNVNISAEAKDSTSGIYKAKLATNETGTFENKTRYGSPVTFSNQTGSYKKAEFTWINQSFTGTLGYKVWFGDAAGNYQSTGINSFKVNDEFPAPWWNTQYSYRKKITVNNTFNSENTTNYNVRLNLSYEGEMKANFSDLRFTYYNTTDGNQFKIDHWTYDKNDTNWAEIFVEAPRISELSKEYLYVYYGNAGANDESQKVLGTPSNPAKSCERINRKTTDAPNTTYYLDPDQDGSDIQGVRCDIGVSDKGWELLYNYDHVGGNTPAPTEGQWPLDHKALSHEDGISSYGYAKPMIESVRLRCETSNHPRILHYVSKSSGIKDGILTTGLTIGVDAVSSFAYKLPEHNASLPDVAGSNTGETEPSNTLFGPAFPMYEGGAHHWSIGSPNGYGSDRWECDDYPDGPQHDTLHQIWFTVNSSLPDFDPRPEVDVGAEQVNQLPDIKINNLTFSSQNLTEGQNYELNVNISNPGEADISSAVIEAQKEGFNGTYFLENTQQKLVSIPSGISKVVGFQFIAEPGFHRFNVTADPEEIIQESDESNNFNQTTNKLSSYQILHGASKERLDLANKQNFSIRTWSPDNVNNTLYFTDSDISFSTSNLLPLNQSGDLEEADQALNLLGHNDSLKTLYDDNKDGKADFTGCIPVSGSKLCDVPLINSTNTTSFRTGILHVSPSSNPYQGDEDLVFVTRTNSSKTGKFGNYDYEARIPFSLENQKPPQNKVSVYREIS